MKYIAFLRGINSGKNPSTKMADLKEVFSDLGFSDIETILASGNVIFSSYESLEKVTVILNTKLPKKLGFKTYALVVSENTIKELIASDPFGDTKQEKGKKCYVSFIGSESVRALPIEKHGFEMKNGPEGMIFSIVDLSITGSPDLMKVLDKNWSENTTRGWSTIEKIGKKL